MTQTDIFDMAKQAGFPTNYSDTTLLHGKEIQAFAKLVDAKATAKEREACAKVCESLFDLEDDTCDEAEKCAKAIRARSGDQK